MVKSARLTDGEMLHLLLGKDPERENDYDERIYQSLRAMRAQTLKSAIWLVAAGAFGVLSHFRGLKSASANGLEVSPTIFSHAALLATSMSTAWFCFSYCKQGYIQLWFSTKFRHAEPKLKALYLLKYPEAFFHFSYMRNAVGYPPQIYSRKSVYTQIASLLLVLVALLLFLVGSWILWITLAIDVWNSADVSRGGTGVTLALSVVLVLLAWTCPFYYDMPKTYMHFGLVNLLSKLDRQENVRAHMKIYQAALRMGLIEKE